MEEYLASLDHRDAREQANRSIIEQYTRIADRLARQQNTIEDSEGLAPTAAGVDEQRIDVQSLRASLAAAQQARATLEAEIASFASLKQESALNVQAIQEQNKEIAALQRKLNDRNAEIREGKKLISQVQEEMADQMVSMNLQLNMAEQKSEKLQNENKELVSRWMKKMATEADKMNEQSKW